MDSIDREVLERALEWTRTGHRVCLITVAGTWGSAPRPVGALAAIREDGVIIGSVSGGCVEDDLINRVRQSGQPGAPELLSYGIDRGEAARWGLPCGGQLSLVAEPLTNAQWIAELLPRLDQGERIARRLDIATGQSGLSPAGTLLAASFDGNTLTSVFGPRWRLLLIGAGQLSRVLAPIAQVLDFRVYVCDPRPEYLAELADAGMIYLPGMPDDVVVAFKPDGHTAIVALTHDLKLDDMALLEALKSPAYYVGALGSRVNNAKRRQRLALFDLSAEQIARLHGPTGLRIGSRTPAEIAVAIAAELVSVRNGMAPAGAMI